jgi:hypothetical protein
MDDERTKPRETPDYFINTAPEMDALERAAADGRHGRNFEKNEDALVIRHSIPGASHYVELGLLPSDQLAGVTFEALDNLVSVQDADTALMFLYVLHLLAPPIGRAAPEMASGIVDFDDVINKIGWDPRSTEERREMHKRLYQFIVFGERAQVNGSRRGIYRDKHTGAPIDTIIRESPWRIFKDETPDQKSLFPQVEVPVRVEIVVSREWTQLLTSPQTAQYLPLGEVLGAIPGNKASGAWARVIGLALASFWRRNPREAIDGTLRPTRHELLERYPPKTGTVTEILEGVNPRRALAYWCDALSILVEKQFIDPRGEALISYKDMQARLPRKGWAEIWLNESVELYPGPNLRPAVERRGFALPVAPPPKKRGRPRKNI